MSWLETYRRHTPEVERRIQQPNAQVTAQDTITLLAGVNRPVACSGVLGRGPIRTAFGGV